MIVICDSHEPTSIVNQLSAKFPQLQVAELGLSSGDLFAQLPNGIFIAERKTPSDFVASIADQRVFEQSQVIPTLARFPFLVLDGELSFSDVDRLFLNRQNGWQQTNWTRESIAMAKVRIQSNGMIWTETDGKSYAERIASLLDWCENKADCGYAHHKQRIAVNPFEDQAKQKRINYLSQLPGVGFDRASALVEWKPEWKLHELETWALTFDPNGEHPRLWGKGTKQTLREYFEVEEGITKVE